MKKRFALLTMCLLALSLYAENGSRLWLRYTLLNQAEVIAPKSSPTIDIAVDELRKYYSGKKVTLQLQKSQTPSDGYTIDQQADGSVTVASSSEMGLLYGTYGLLRMVFTYAKPHVSTSPTYGLRILNHWDNPDGSIERGYAGKSIFNWFHLDENLLREYARANASIGINGSVLNNVNASPKMLTRQYLEEVKKIADWFRPYGIKVYLSVNFGSPKALGETTTADPLDKKVQRWWQRKAKEIYSLIPDFGGFLVKANSEGQPGPGDYGRTHAEGANMLAKAVKKYGGIIMWRSFVYGANHKGEDRVKQAVSEFKMLDGKFADNVILQSKNGPLDFQPREPYAPIFDNIKQTTQMAELQITQEYLGQSIHLVYLAPMWEEFFQFVNPQMLKGIAGVANIGNDANWCGHHFSQANWYAFGRLAWNPSMKSEEIANEWLMQTFDVTDQKAKDTMLSMMMRSREACVYYMMPLGLHHIFKFDHHYGPEPDGYKAEYPIEWCPVYYHQADANGVGFDRTSTTGTNAVEQYREPYRSMYDNVNTCPDEYLLWFHHLPWNHVMKNGKTLWQNLCTHYDKGVKEAASFVGEWRQVRPYVDDERWQEVDERITQQLFNAMEWRNVCLKYFQTFSKMPLEKE